MTFQSKKAARKSLTSQIETDVTDFQDVLDHLPENFGGESPICTVESGPYLPIRSGSAEENKITLVVGVWVNRTPNGVAAYSAAEDEMDDLTTATVNSIIKWNNGTISRPTMPFYEPIDGEEYRVGLIFVEIDWQGA